MHNWNTRSRFWRHNDCHGWRMRIASLLCAVTLLFGMIAGELSPFNAMAVERVCVCGQEEHVHGETCFETFLRCTLEEHSHSEACFAEDGSLICPLVEHWHTENCWESVLCCGKAEHRHSGACYIELTPEPTSMPTPEPTPVPTPEPTPIPTPEPTPDRKSVV